MKNKIIALALGALMSFSCAFSQPIHPQIMKSVDFCLDDFVNLTNEPELFVNKYLNKDYDSINISLFFYLDTNNALCYDVFTFHQLANDSIPLLGCYPIGDRTLLYIYDQSGLASNFIDTSLLQRPRPSRFDHVIKYDIPERTNSTDYPIIEGLEYSYIIGYQIETRKNRNGVVIKKIKRRNFINDQYYTYYPKLKWFLGL